MSIYKMRVMFEDDENINRDIELRPSDSFVVFEENIIQAWGLPKDNKGAFYISNDRAQKVKSINHTKKLKTGESFIYAMISHYVEYPHQKFIYESFGKQDLVFLIELIIIGNEKPGTTYPRISKSNGPSPVKKEDVYKHISATAIPIEADEALDDDEDRKLIASFGTEGEDEEKPNDDLGLGDDEEVQNSDEEETESSDDSEEEFGGDNFIEEDL